MPECQIALQHSPLPSCGVEKRQGSWESIPDMVASMGGWPWSLSHSTGSTQAAALCQWSGQEHFLSRWRKTQREATEQDSEETAVSHREERRSAFEKLKLQDNKDQDLHTGYWAIACILIGQFLSTKWNCIVKRYNEKQTWEISFKIYSIPWDMKASFKQW